MFSNTLDLNQIPESAKAFVQSERDRLAPLIAAKDAELCNQGMAPHQRKLQCIDSLTPENPRCESLFCWQDDRTRTWLIIEEWYSARFALQATNPIGPIGHIPFELRGAVFLLTIPLIFGRPTIDLLILVKDLPVVLKNELSAAEKTEIHRLFRVGLVDFGAMEALQHAWIVAGNPPPFFAEWYRIARQNLDTAIDAAHLRRREEAVWSAQQAAEKEMKAYLTRMGVSEQTLRGRTLGHNLTALHEACITHHPNLAGLRPWVTQVDVGPDVRYPSNGLTQQDMLTSVHAAIRVVGNLAGGLMPPLDRVGQP